MCLENILKTKIIDNIGHSSNKNNNMKENTSHHIGVTMKTHQHQCRIHHRHRLAHSSDLKNMVKKHLNYESKGKIMERE